MKKHRHREPNGRLSRSEGDREFPPTLVRRAMDDAKRKYSDRRWGTQLGRLYLTGSITASQFAAGERWGMLAAKYHLALNAPLPDPRSVKLELGLHGQEPDPDSEGGKQVAINESGVVKRMHKAHAALLVAGKSGEAAVRDVCEKDLNVGGFMHAMLVHGLELLARHWNLTEDSRHARQNVR